MNTTFVLGVGIIFIVVAVIFSAIAFFLSLPSSVEKAAISRPAGIIFYVIGALTFVIGILTLMFRKEMTRNLMEGFALVYLVVITILFAMFTALVGKKNGKENERDSASR